MADQDDRAEDPVDDDEHDEHSNLEPDDLIKGLKITFPKHHLVSPIVRTLRWTR